MKIGIDGFSLVRNDSGIEVYTKELIAGIQQQDLVEVYAYADISIPKHQNLYIKNSRIANPRAIDKLWWELITISTMVSPDVDVYHCPHFILPFNLKKQKKVVTLHDLAFLKRPEFFDKYTRLYYSIFLKQSLKKADEIICISSSCFQDLVEYFPSLKLKASVVYNGFKDFSKIPADDGILNDLALQSPYVLLIGTLNPRKNIKNAIQAFQDFARDRDIELVIVGDLKRMDNLQLKGLSSKIHFTGFIDEARLSSLYQNAALLLFPSHYEGFGFPILEAMSVGLPVLTSNVASMPEVSGYDAEWLCDPWSTKSIQQLLIKFLDSSNREFLKEHAKNNVKRFSWERMVAETRMIYEH